VSQVDSPDAAQTIVDPRDAALSVGLKYVSDERPGFDARRREPDSATYDLTARN
jgi:hypothetical protein